jgi:multidrug resistance efflux pump
MAVASLTSARAQMQEAERELARNNGLFERAVISQAQLDAVLTNRDIAGAEVAKRRQASP